MQKETRLAIALKYDSDEHEAPQVTASGQGRIAGAMVAAALSSGVPVHEDRSLARLLARLEIGSGIPPELYQAVAQVLAFIWLLEQDQRAPGVQTP